MKGKFRIEIIEPHYLLFQVLEMDERFRVDKTKAPYNYYRASNKWIVRSYIYPTINPYLWEVNVWGRRREKDTLPFVLNCWTEEQAKEIKENILIALKEWAERWSGWGKKDEDEQKLDNHIYEF